MSTKKNTNDNKEKNCDNNQENNDAFENLVQNTDFKLIDFEKAGAALLAIGYSTYIAASNAEAQELLGFSVENMSSDDIFILGQKFVVSGYLILYLVSVLRVKEKIYEKEHEQSNFYVQPFINISLTYLFSVFINVIRLKAFTDIKYDDELEKRTPSTEDN